MGYAGGVNLYNYTQNDPVNGMDPDGTDDIDTSISVTLTGIGIVTGGTIGAGGGGVAGFGVGAIPGAVVGAGVGGLAGAASAAVVIGLRHAIMSMFDSGGGGGAGIETGPETSGGPYSHLQDPAGVGPGKEFTPAQKEAIYKENMERNDGVIRDDETGEELQRIGAYGRNQKVPANAAQIDHIISRNPADPDVAPGTNSYSNARVISRASNRAKSNSCPSK